MTRNPLVSVHMVTYNHGAFIVMAIESVLNQKTDFDFELVIGDDYSTDETRTIIKEYSFKYPEIIKAFLNSENLGLGGRNNSIKTLKACKGKYIAILEGDDYWKDANKLQKQVDFMEQHSGYAAYCGNAVYVNEGVELKKVRNWNVAKDVTTKDFLYGNDVITGTILFRNQLFSHFFKMLQTAYAGDWMLFYYLSKKGKFYFSPEILSAYRIHSDGAWNKLDQIQRLQGERRMKMIILKDNMLNGNSFILLKEIIKINGTLFNIRARKIVKSILGERIMEQARKLKRL